MSLEPESMTSVESLLFCHLEENVPKELRSSPSVSAPQHCKLGLSRLPVPGGQRVAAFYSLVKTLDQPLCLWF